MSSSERGSAKRAWRPAPEALVDLFHKALSSFPQARLKKSFGYPSAMIGEHMFAGLHQESFVARLPEQDRAELAERHGGRPFEPMPGRVMGEFMALPETILRSPHDLEDWLGRALKYTQTLPPKRKKGASKG